MKPLNRVVIDLTIVVLDTIARCITEDIESRFEFKELE